LNNATGISETYVISCAIMTRQRFGEIYKYNMHYVCAMETVFRFPTIWMLHATL